MLIRFMEGQEIMEAPSEQVNDFMSGIVERVSNYQNQTSYIGFSFRYYIEGIIKKSDIKMVSIDGVATTIENIKKGNYPIVTSLYVVTYKENKNENVELVEEVNKLFWINKDENFFDIDKFAGEGNIGHMVLQTEIHKTSIFQ